VFTARYGLTVSTPLTWFGKSPTPASWKVAMPPEAVGNSRSAGQVRLSATTRLTPRDELRLAVFGYS
jgi:hypothetical protein